MTHFRPMTVFAPAKINLYLHIVGRREDGYHDLDSLVVFADIGDRVTLEPANDFSFHLTGPFASAFTVADRHGGIDSSNLVTRAVRALSARTGHDPALRVTLTKTLPLASGLGGGSADAAATIWGLMNLWKIPITAPFLHDLMAEMGADIPACLRCAPMQMTGIGDILDHVPNLPEIPVVLVNPGKHCPTPAIFKRFMGPMRGAVELPHDLSDAGSLIEFLKRTDNDLTPAAIEVVPEIGIALQALEQSDHCALARMSGSGATVFGLFDNSEDAQDAAERIILANPNWWVRTGTINSPERY